MNNSPERKDRQVPGIKQALFQNKSPLAEATSPFIMVFRGIQRIINDEKGESDSGCAITLLSLSVTAALIMGGVVQCEFDKKQDQKIANLQQQVGALQTAVVRTNTSVAEQTSKQPVIEVAESPSLYKTVWYQGEITIRPSDIFKPSRTNDGLSRAGGLTQNRRPENLISWEDIIDLNGTPIESATSLQIKNPLVASATEEIPLSEALLGFKSRYNWFYLIKLRATIKGPYGQRERRYIYIPLDTPDSQDFIEGYNLTKGKTIYVKEDKGRFYHDADLFQDNLGEIPANEIGIVTPQY